MTHTPNHKEPPIATWFVSYRWDDIISGRSGWGQQPFQIPGGGARLKGADLVTIKKSLEHAIKVANPGTLNPNVTIIFFAQVEV